MMMMTTFVFIAFVLFIFVTDNKVESLLSLSSSSSSSAAIHQTAVFTTTMAATTTTTSFLSSSSSSSLVLTNSEELPVAITTISSSSSWDNNNLINIVTSPESIQGPINFDTPEWIRSLVWTDFRLAVTFFVVFPLILLLWSAFECFPKTTTTTTAATTKSQQRQQVPSSSSSSSESLLVVADAVLRIITGYWQASALLLITVLWNIVSSPIGVVTGAIAQLMIYISLNWWYSLNEEATSVVSSYDVSSNNNSNNKNNNIEEESTSSSTSPSIYTLGGVFGLWRIIASYVAGIGVAIQIPFLPCAATTTALKDNPYCSAWLEPPQTAAALLGIVDQNNLEVVELLATITLTIYVGYLVYYILIPLQQIGHDGRATRTSFTFIDGWIALGFLQQQQSSSSSTGNLIDRK